MIAEAEGDEPYRVCSECAGRLRRSSLRPLEWFNLAAKHGWSRYYLHGDFYDQDGSARQPKIERYSTEGVRPPVLGEAARSLERLLDYCITRWSVGTPEYDALARFSGEAVLRELKLRAASGNRHVAAVTLTLCANVLGDTAESWVRSCYQRCRDDDDMLFSWAEAAARCLPAGEGLHKTIDALQKHSGKALRERMVALSWFRSPTVLDWIEHHAPRVNVTEEWGRLAAVSELPWSRVEVWLSSGRPLSLIALDALTALIRRHGQAAIVARLHPKLREPPDRLTLTRALRACEAADTAPRVSSKCRYLAEHVAELIGDS